MTQQELKKFITVCPNFPKKDVTFYDWSPLLSNVKMFNNACKHLSQIIEKGCDVGKLKYVIGLDARGFVIMHKLASELNKNAGTIMIRKYGKIPCSREKVSYSTEYSDDNALCLPENIIQPGDDVILCDDLLATGGTLIAEIKTAQEYGANVIGVACMLELPKLNGRNAIHRIFPTIPISSLIQLDDLNEEIMDGKVQPALCFQKNRNLHWINI
jgi:adenine phosphoribosyltransferase